jgi:hypothetical protein
MSKGLLAILAMAKQIAKSANEQRSIGNLGNGKTNSQECQ